MVLKEMKPRNALNKAFLKVKPNRAAIESFKTNLYNLSEEEIKIVEGVWTVIYVIKWFLWFGEVGVILGITGNHRNRTNHSSDIYDLTEEEIKIVARVLIVIYVIRWFLWFG